LAYERQGSPTFLLDAFVYFTSAFFKSVTDPLPL
jgi:hypothetical protein